MQKKAETSRTGRPPLSAFTLSLSAAYIGGKGECNVNVYLFAAVILLLLIACAALAVPVALLSPKWLIAPAVLVVAALGVLWYQRRRLLLLSDGTEKDTR